MGPFIVDEDGYTLHVPTDQIAGYGNVPYQTFEESDVPDEPVRKRRPMLFTGPPDEERLSDFELRLRRKLNDHWHEPDPLAGASFSPRPGRSPPR